MFFNKCWCLSCTCVEYSNTEIKNVFCNSQINTFVGWRVGERVRNALHAIIPSELRPTFTQTRHDVVLTVAIAKHVVEGLHEFGESVGRVHQVYEGGHPGALTRTTLPERPHCIERLAKNMYDEQNNTRRDSSTSEVHFR